MQNAHCSLFRIPADPESPDLFSSVRVLPCHITRTSLRLLWRSTEETPMISRYFLAGLLLCLLCTPLLARPGTICTKDGRSIEGYITDRGAEGATISTRAGQIT